MAISLKSLGIDNLGLDERLALIEELWDGISDDVASIPLTDPQRTELERRIADHDENPDDVIAWDALRASIAERISKTAE